MKNEEHALADLLQNLQINVMSANRTQCNAQWGDLDYTPEYNKLYFIEEGEGWLKIGDKEFHPKPGQLCLMPAHVKQSYSTVIDRKPFLKYWCHFTVTAGPFDLFQWIGVPFFIDVEDTERMTELFAQLTALHGSRSLVSVLQEKSIMLEIISRYLGQVPVRVLKHRSEEMDRLTVIHDYVENHLHTSMSIDEMAAALHLHPNYFIAYFRKHFGIPPAKYVNRKRAERAKLLLTTTPLSVKEIAERTGFADTNHFTKFFRKESGHSPTEFRSLYS
jgi:AraC family transcriptional regulator of arabinose operon